MDPGQLKLDAFEPTVREGFVVETGSGCVLILVTEVIPYGTISFQWREIKLLESEALPKYSELKKISYKL